MMLIPLLLCLLLCGCAQDVPPAETALPAAARTETISEEAAEPLQAAARALELQYGNTLQVTPLLQRKVQGIRALEDGLLVFSGHGSTTLTLLAGDTLSETASLTLEFELDPLDPALRVSGKQLSYYDPVTREIVVLEQTLTERSRIAMDSELLGTPILSSDLGTVYYCTSSAIRALDVESGIHRCVKELAYTEQALTGLHMEDSVLQCRILDGEKVHTLFLSAQTGQLLADVPRDITLDTLGDRYYASFTDGTVQSLIFGKGSEAPQALQPEQRNAQCTFLPEQNGAVTVSSLSEGDVQLDYFSLETGQLLDSLPLDIFHHPVGIASGGGCDVFLLIYDPENDCHFLCRWEVPEPGDGLPGPGAAVYTGTYYTAQSPDVEALAQCQAYADRIGQQHGIGILVWKDATAVQPWDYVFETEYLPQILMSAEAAK